MTNIRLMKDEDWMIHLVVEALLGKRSSISETKGFYCENPPVRHGGFSHVS